MVRAEGPHPAAERLLGRGAELLASLLAESRRPDWAWFEAVLAYDNPRLPQALIEAGAVYVDGEQVSDVGRKIAPGQTLVLNDRAELGLGARLEVELENAADIILALPFAGVGALEGSDFGGGRFGGAFRGDDRGNDR